MKQELAAEQRGASRGMQTFLLIWFGQLISVLGIGLTSFGLGVNVLRLLKFLSESARDVDFVLTAYVNNDCQVGSASPIVPYRRAIGGFVGVAATPGS